MTRRNRPPLSLSKLAKAMENKDGKIAVVVGTVTDDKRIYDVPKLTVCAMRFTEAQSRPGRRSATSGRRQAYQTARPRPACARKAGSSRWRAESASRAATRCER